MKSFCMVKKVAVAAVSLGFTSFSTASFADDTLRIVSWGGAYKRANLLAFFNLPPRLWASQ